MNSNSPKAPATVAALMTPPGRGALAAVAVRGPDAHRAVAACCLTTPGNLSSKLNAGSLWLGAWGGLAGELVVVHVCRPDFVEICSHGGTFPSQKILAELAGQGIRIVTWAKLVRADSATLIEAEAVEALAYSATLRAADILLAQANGTLGRFLSDVQAEIRAGRLTDAGAKLDALLSRARVGLHLTKPWRIAIVGRPNVGKSSLLNAIVGFDRAIVHCEAGTTRDLVTAATAIDGWPVEFGDSAGLRTTIDELESAGIERARRAIAESDLQLVVLDRSMPLTLEDRDVVRLCPSPVIVANKCDLASVWDRLDDRTDALLVSARTGLGLSSLIDRLGQRLVPKPPEADAAVPFTPRQVAAIHAAAELVRQLDAVTAIESIHDAIGCDRSA